MIAATGHLNYLLPLQVWDKLRWELALSEGAKAKLAWVVFTPAVKVTRAWRNGNRVVVTTGYLRRF